MSHNTPKIGTATQDRAGALDTSLTDLNDVSGSPALSSALTYNGGWSPTTAPAGSQATEVVGWIGGYLNTFWLGSTKQPGPGGFYYMAWGGPTYRPLYYQDTSHITFKTNNGYNAWSTTSAWYVDRAELAAGTYRFNFRHVVYSGFSAPYMDVRWETLAGDPLGPIRRISEPGVPCNVSGAGKFSVATTIGLKVHGDSGGNQVPYGSTGVPQFNQNLQVSIVRIA